MSKGDQNLNVLAVAQRLRALLVETGVASESDSLFAAACNQISSHPNHPHPQPCLDEKCRPCAYARSLLVICDHLAQTTTFELVGDLEHPAHELRNVAAEARSVHRELLHLRATLEKHMERRRRIHAGLKPLGARAHRSDVHEALCVRPLRALKATQDLIAQLEGLPDALLAPMRPEARAMGHRAPDTLFADIVKHLLAAQMSKQEIVALVDVKKRAKPGSSLHDYWMARINRALKTIDRHTNKRKGKQ